MAGAGPSKRMRYGRKVWQRQNKKSNEKYKLLLKKDSSEILFTLLIPWNITALDQLNIDHNETAFFIRDIEKASRSDHRKNVASLLSKVIQNENFSCVLSRYLTRLAKLDGPMQKLHKDALLALLQVFTSFQQFQPTMAQDVLPDVMLLIEKICNEARGSKLKVALKKLTGHTMKQPTGDFRTLSIFPTAADIQGKAPDLLPNITQRRYDNVEDYLDVHFCLLREDYVRSLRDGIAEYRKLKEERKSVERIDGVRLYENVLIFDYKAFHGEIVHVVQFDKVKFQNVNFEHSKSLLHGTLLCFSSDDFETMMFATVAERNDKCLKDEGQLFVKFEDVRSNLFDIPPNLKFAMIETEAYFEAYRHNLAALCNMTKDNFPMQKYIVRVEKDVSYPCYLKKNTTYDFSPLLHQKPISSGSSDNHSDFNVAEGLDHAMTDVLSLSHDSHKSVNVLDFSQWPTQEDLGLNKSQFEALKAAVTKDFAIIQGPPGTGKTFIGLRIMKLLLHNSSSKNSRPILVVCYTNHALDQFLEDMLSFTTKIVRVGGRSQSEKLEPYRLKNQALQLKKSRNVPDYLHHTMKVEDSALKQLKEELLACRKKIIAASQGICNYDILRDVIDSHHFEALLKLCTKGMDYFLNIDRFGVGQNLLMEDSMSVEEVKDVHNISQLSLVQRWRLYRYWLKNYVKLLQDQMLVIEEKFLKKRKIKKEMENELHLYILRRTAVVGMTTTGAAKNLKLLRLLQPEVIVVEEAAEILEAHIVSALTSSIEHIILIGDHQQLKPKTNIRELTTKYNFDMSLFERMVNNGIECNQLSIQHRMSPTIASLLVPLIYPLLENHESVTNFDKKKIKGMHKNMFFVYHQMKEEGEMDTQSKRNSHEARFIIELCGYLLKQGYNSNQITILTPYSGQLSTLRSIISKRRSCESVRVAVVDDFQGDENDIILLSFVRSNEEGRIGFLKESNRVCVALSRARKGLYCIGNFNMFAEKSDLWNGIVQTLKKKDAYGTSLRLLCQKHHTHTPVSKEEDFEAVRDGGCKLACNYRLECGHQCTRLCHPDDRQHKEFICMKD